MVYGGRIFGRWLVIVWSWRNKELHVDEYSWPEKAVVIICSVAASIIKLVWKAKLSLWMASKGEEVVE
ncbi:unnamed protein product [Trifolium pratense]|uniref:Uncharacterized protein n=1 Tax=Trifolium pratense TaxID=57577 RepID=A0ACB0J7G9_TRIPR|nr:unnamed protein product [Trifolium pratense]